MKWFSEEDIRRVVKEHSESLCEIKECPDVVQEKIDSMNHVLYMLGKLKDKKDFEKEFLSFKKKVKRVIDDNIHPMMYKKHRKMLKELGLGK